MVSNEVYTGAGLSATLIPEMDFEVSEAFGLTTNSMLLLSYKSGTTDELDWSKLANGSDQTTVFLNDTRLVTDIYKGCLAKVRGYDTNGSGAETEQTLLIQSNGSHSIKFGEALSSTVATVKYKCTILAYGAPVYSPAVTADEINLLSDNWLGLVSTITPPTVTAELKQMNLALGGTRNFGYQFKGAETVDSGSMDVSLNHGAWLYYVLGKMDSKTPSSLHGSSTLGSDLAATTGGKDFYASATTTDTKIYRVEKGVGNNLKVIPPLPETATAANYKMVLDANYFTYDFSESDTGDLPSFSIEVTAEKGHVDPYNQDAATENMFSRIYTGCQVDSMTLNFEEGQDVKSSLSFVSRKCHNSPTDYVPKRGVQTSTSLMNFKGRTNDDNNPYMFSDGSLKIYGQTLARIKSGSLTINNGLTPQRFIGNYDRTITSRYIGGQRTYDLQLTLLITDRTIWDELRNQNETTSTVGSSGAAANFGLIELEFAKSATDKIQLKFDNYLTSNVDIPFPDDKGALEVTLTVNARTLNDCKYLGKWAIQG
jgi:hypothetical protein